MLMIRTIIKYETKVAKMKPWTIYDDGPLPSDSKARASEIKRRKRRHAAEVGLCTMCAVHPKLPAYKYCHGCREANLKRK